MGDHREPQAGRAEAHRLARFKTQCTNPTTATVTTADFQVTLRYTEAQLCALPGFQRLHPELSPIEFETARALLLQCATETVAQELKPHTADAALDLIGAQFPRHPAGETIPQFFARLMKAHEACRSTLSTLKKLHLLPHPDTLTKLVASKVRVEYTREVLRFLENSDISETDFSLDDTAALYMKAAARTVRVFPVLQQAIEVANANQ